MTLAHSFTSSEIYPSANLSSASVSDRRASEYQDLSREELQVLCWVYRDMFLLSIPVVFRGQRTSLLDDSHVL